MYGLEAKQAAFLTRRTPITAGRKTRKDQNSPSHPEGHLGEHLATTVEEADQDHQLPPPLSANAGQVPEKATPCGQRSCRQLSTEDEDAQECAQTTSQIFDVMSRAHNLWRQPVVVRNDKVTAIDRWSSLISSLLAYFCGGKPLPPSRPEDVRQVLNKLHNALRRDLQTTVDSCDRTTDHILTCLAERFNEHCEQGEVPTVAQLKQMIRSSLNDAVNRDEEVQRQKANIAMEIFGQYDVLMSKMVVVAGESVDKKKFIEDRKSAEKTIKEDILCIAAKNRDALMKPLHALGTWSRALSERIERLPWEYANDQHTLKLTLEAHLCAQDHMDTIVTSALAVNRAYNSGMQQRGETEILWPKPTGAWKKAAAAARYAKACDNVKVKDPESVGEQKPEVSRKELGTH